MTETFFRLKPGKSRVNFEKTEINSIYSENLVF